MKYLAWSVLVALGAAGVAHAQAVNWDFEPPAYAPGGINGLQGWSAGGTAGPTVVNTFAAHGTQSLRMAWPSPASGNASKATGFNSPAYWSASFNLYINGAATSASSFASISLGTGLGTTWYFGVFGDGKIEDFGGANPVHDDLGIGALNQWLSISTWGYNPTGDIFARVQGVGIDRTYYTNFGVQTVRQDLVTLGVNNQVWSGAFPLDVYFDDVVVTTTPAPGAAAVLGVGGLLMGRRRRRN